MKTIDGVPVIGWFTEDFTLAVLWTAPAAGGLRLAAGPVPLRRTPAAAASRTRLGVQVDPAMLERWRVDQAVVT